MQQPQAGGYPPAYGPPVRMAALLGAACRDARQTADLRQLDIATSAGVDHSTISRFEDGAVWADDPDRIVAAYARELGVTEKSLWQAALDRG